MARTLRPDLAHSNPYYISRHRYYELKHFCLQYYEWKLAYNDAIFESGKRTLAKIRSSDISDRTADVAIKLATYSMRMALVEETVREASQELSDYLFKAVTEDRSFTYLKTMCYIPCERDMYYDRYRKFFWLLDKKR